MKSFKAEYNYWCIYREKTFNNYSQLKGHVESRNYIELLPLAENMTVVIIPLKKSKCIDTRIRYFKLVYSVIDGSITWQSRRRESSFCKQGIVSIKVGVFSSFILCLVSTTTS